MISQGISWPLLPQVRQGLQSCPMPTLAPGKLVNVDDIPVVVVRLLAEGGFSQVYLVTLDIDDPNIKTRQAVLKQMLVKDEETLEKFKKEIDVMKRLTGHKNIVEYFASRITKLEEDASPYKYEVLILMEYSSGGEVVDLMNSRIDKERMTESEIVNIFADVCEAVLWMHSCKPAIIHRDLKVENVLVSDDGVYKLCDYGSATTVDTVDSILSQGRIEALEDDISTQTTLQYRAPELIDVSRHRPITEKVDIWALGILLYKLCYYTTPFEENSETNILHVSYAFPKVPHYSLALQQLISSMLKENPDDRPNIEQVKRRVEELRLSPPTKKKRRFWASFWS